MPQIIIRGISINFPYEAYDCQIAYMSSVIDSLIDNKNAILESPTGTGKTLCLLCACLAWQDHVKSNLPKYDDKVDYNNNNNNNQSASIKLWNKKNIKLDKNSANKRNSSVPRIIYTSRTHSQLSQCIKALKACSYGVNRKVGMIASRDQLCVNSSIISMETTSARIYGCRKVVRTRQCRFYNQFDSNREKIVEETPIVDIEDLVVAGKEKTFCPYYLSRETFASADIAFMPYNYILDSRVRKMFKIDLSQSVIIFDEAHNVEQVCEDSASVDLSSLDIAKAIGELTNFAEYIYKERFSVDLEEADDQQKWPELSQVLTMKQRLLAVETALEEIDLREHRDGITETVIFLFRFLEETGFKQNEKLGFFDVLETSISVIGMSSDPAVHSIGIKGLEAVEAFLRTVFSEEETIDHDNLAKCYRVYIQEKELRHTTSKSIWESKKASANVQKQKILSFWCLSPGQAMKELIKADARNIILTSGTLYPIDSLKMDLKIDIGVELRNNHIIKSEQMMISVCTKGPDGESLNSSYESRDKISYINSLGNTLVNLTAVVPRGLLVVFPSYHMMKKCLEKWESCNIYSRMVHNKEVVVEPQDKVAFGLAMQKYTTANLDPKNSMGAVLLAVARGKISEGLDLADHCGRGVVIVGLPYPSFVDPRIKLKMSFLDDRFIAEGKGLGGRRWYNLQAYRAVNQSLGRVIRHHRDFGSVYLCDERFASPSSKLQMPHWVQPMITVHNNFGDVIRATTSFFRNIPLKYPPTSLGNEVTLATKSISSSQRPVIKGNLPFLNASDVQSFCHSLKKSNAEDLFQMYSENVDDLPPIAEKDTSLISILKKSESIRPLSHVELKKRQLDQITTSNDPVTEKKPIKRYRLVNKKEIRIDYSKHLLCAKRVLNSNMNAMKSYKSVVEQYSVTGNVDSLFSSLLTIFNINDHPGLVRDFYVHLRPEHQPRYRVLCTTMLGLECTDDKENVVQENIIKPAESLDCVHCEASPAVTPLGAPCKHICCFSCWKDVIDGENATRRCPKCKEIVRKKTLVKLV